MKRYAALVLLLALLGSPSLEAAEEKPRWIVVSAPAFADALDPLCAHRRSQGHDVVRIDMGALWGDATDPSKAAAQLKLRIAKLCGEVKGTCTVLLVGALHADDAGKLRSTVVPALAGRVGRMEGKPSDNSYGCLDDDLLPDVAVGRFPVRSPEDASAMVRKTLALENSNEAGAWRQRVTLLVGHPGGTSAMQRRMAATMVKGAVASGFGKVNRRWRTRAVLHMVESPFCVPDDRLRDLSQRYLQDGQLLSIYLGHSGASGFSSGSAPFISNKDWASMKLGPRAGIFVTCGCWACHEGGFRGDGYGIAAMRNPAGPAAVIGAFGESYGAAGKLALEGMLTVLAEREPPERLGAWWLALKRGLAQGKIGALTFMLYDRADGSGGKVPLAVQRREHLEMWMLLGDPALRLPLESSDIDLEVEGPFKAGETLVVRGRLPKRLATQASKVRITLERPFGTEPVGLEPLPKAKGDAYDAAMLRRHEAMNNVVLFVTEVSDAKGSFECRVPLPAELAWDSLTLRAHASAGQERAWGILALPTGR